MQEIVPGLWLLQGFPPYAINAYLAGDMLVDSGTSWYRGMLLRQLRGRDVRVHVLTHAHPDHQGSSAALCRIFGAPLWCGARDASVAESGATVELLPPTLPVRIVGALWSGPGYPVSRALSEGDTIGEWEVLATPGHTLGHIGLWRARDRVLIAGDVIVNNHPLTQLSMLREPLAHFTLNPALNRRSARKLAELHPRVVCFGHGPPLMDGARFIEFVEQLGGRPGERETR